jgi:SAM-dependent methyltransferase
MKPNEGRISDPFALYEDESYAGWHTDDEQWKASLIERFLRLHLPDCGSIADVGCGTGGVIAGLQSAFPLVKMAGYEVAPVAVSKAMELYPDIEFRVGFPESNEFELIMLVDVVEHVQDCWKLLSESRRSAPYLLAHIPLEMNVSTALRPQALASSRRVLGHIHHFSAESACALFTDCGYTVVASEITAATAEMPGRSMKRRIARGPRKIGKKVSPGLAARLLGGFEILILAKRS